ncbi:hypothetical protein [Rhodococcus yananensis]
MTYALFRIHQRRTPTTIGIAALSACVVATAACTSNPVEPTPDDATADPFAVLAADSQVMSHQWTAPADVDLDAPEIQVVRAYADSEWNLTRTADYAATYPGYDDVAEDRFKNLNPRTGTIVHNILEARTTTHLGRPATEVHICIDFMNTAQPLNEGWIRKESLGYQSFRVQQTTWTSPSTPPLDYDRRMPYPTWNVFDGWEIHGMIDRRKDDGLPWSNCMSALPGFDYDAPYTARVPAPPTVEPFYPGWPTAIDSGE